MSERLPYQDTTPSLLGSPTRNLVSVLVFMAVVVVAATLAYMAAGWSFTDASYMVALTVYTVGYGEVRPIDTTYLHAVTMATMVLGCTGMILLTSTLVQFFTVLQLRQILSGARMQEQIGKLSGHVIICGYGRIGMMLARDLTEARMPLLVIERSAEKAAEVEAAGHLCLVGDATDESALELAGIQRARALATVLPDDAANVFITLSARKLAAELEIIARGEAPTTESKLRHAGADHVVLPTHIGAERIARLVLYPESRNMPEGSALVAIAEGLDTLGLELQQLLVGERSTMDRLTIAEAERRGGGAFFLVGINRGERGSMVRPAPDETLQAGDRVLVLARPGAAAALSLFTTREKIRSGRNFF